MRITPVMLAIDTSTRTVGLALFDGAQVLCESIWSSNGYHTVELAPAIAEAFARTGIRMEALTSVAVATGPGSFTGLRVGLALAKGMAIARRLTLLGIPTLDALAAAQPPAEIPLLATLRAGRGRLALGEYRYHNGWKSEGKLEVLTLEELVRKLDAPMLVCGELTEEERRRLSTDTPARVSTPAQSLRRPSYLAELAWKRRLEGQSDDPAGLAPTYLHYNDPIPV